MIDAKRCLALIGAGLLFACGEKSVPPAMPKPKVAGVLITFPADSPQLAVLTIAPVAEGQESAIELTARMVWNEERTVRIFPPFAGRVTRITAQPGDQVKAGQALAIIASPDFGQAQADAGKAAADFALAEKNIARIRELFDNGVAPRKDLAVAEAEQARARSELTRAQGRIRLYGGAESPDHTLALKTPITGIVVERNLNPGQELRTDQGGAAALFVVTDPSHLWVQVDAREQDLPLLVKGARFKVKVASYPGEVFEATLEAVADFIDPQTRVIKSRGSIENAARKLKGEMLATAEFSSRGARVVTVPARAVLFADGRHYAFVERGKGSFERVTVVPGAARRDQLVVNAGLAAGQRIVVEGVLLLQQVMRSGSSKAEAE